jgi:prephenate dehydrogenase
MGGSLGKAVRSLRLAETVVGYARRPETRRLALRRRVVDRGCDRVEDAVQGADMVVFCVPVLAIPPLARICRPHLSRGCIVTDVGSTKAHLASELGRIFRGRGIRFVGSHPIAGSEQTGLEAARRDLYRGAVVAVTAAAGRDRLAAAKVARFWQALGATVVRMTPEDHDRIVARTSHLPHLAAAALVNAVCRRDDPIVRALCGPGFQDTTRVAEGSPEVWHDIVRSNRKAVLAELQAYRGILGDLAALVKSGQWKQVSRFLENSRRRRRQLVK